MSPLKKKAKKFCFFFLSWREISQTHSPQTNRKLRKKNFQIFFHNIMNSGNWQANQILYSKTTWKSQIHYQSFLQSHTDLLGLTWRVAEQWRLARKPRSVYFCPSANWTVLAQRWQLARPGGSRLCSGSEEDHGLPASCPHPCWLVWEMVQVKTEPGLG